MINNKPHPMTNAAINPTFSVGDELVSLVVVVISVDSLGVLIGEVVVGETVVKDVVELIGLSIKKESKSDPLRKYEDTTT